MPRMTKNFPEGNGHFVEPEAIIPIPGGFGGVAVERLAKFENLCEELYAQQERFTVQMEELKKAGKNKSVKFRELMGRKLMNANILILLETHGLGQND